MRRRILRAVILLVAVAGVVLWWISRSGGHRDPTALTLYGNVDIRQVDLGFRVAGRVSSMKLEEGDPVRAGALLAELDPRPFQDELGAAEAQVAQQRATLEKLQHGPRPEEIAQARAAVTAQKATLDNARIALQRAKVLRASAAVPQERLDDAQMAFDAAQARLDSATAALRLLQEGTRAEDLANGRAVLEAAQARLASAQTALADTRLTAPADGIILSRVVEPGAIVGPNSVVYVLSLTRPVWVRAYVGEPQLGRVHPGMEVSVLSDSEPHHPYRGHIGFISPVAEFTPKSVETPELRTALVYRLRVIIDAPDQTLRQGMPVTVSVPLAGSKG